MLFVGARVEDDGNKKAIPQRGLTFGVGFNNIWIFSYY